MTLPGPDVHGWNTFSSPTSNNIDGHRKTTFTFAAGEVMYTACLAVILVSSCMLTGCVKKAEADRKFDESIAAKKEGIDEQAARAKNSLDRQREAYYAGVDEHMGRVSAYLDSLETAYGQAKGDAKVELRKRISDLSAVRDTLRQRYMEVRTASEDSYRNLQRRFDSLKERNRFWEPNYNTQPKPDKNAGTGVKLAPNTNRK